MHNARHMVAQMKVMRHAGRGCESHQSAGRCVDADWARHTICKRRELGRSRRDQCLAHALHCCGTSLSAEKAYAQADSVLHCCNTSVEVQHQEGACLVGNDCCTVFVLQEPLQKRLLLNLTQSSIEHKVQSLIEARFMAAGVSRSDHLQHDGPQRAQRAGRTHQKQPCNGRHVAGWPHVCSHVRVLSAALRECERELWHAPLRLGLCWR